MNTAETHDLITSNENLGVPPKPSKAHQTACDLNPLSQPQEIHNMNTYEQKQAERKERYEQLAQKAESDSLATLDRAREMSSWIPPGQPILIGHHSENRDRRFREKIHNTYGKAFKESEKAEYFARKAASVGTGGISSDDPQAIEKIKAEIEHLRNAQDQMKKINAVIRSRRGDEDAQLDGLLALGFLTNEQAKEILTPDCMGTIGFARFSLSNNNANINRLEKRIKHIEAVRQRAPVAIKTDNYEYREDGDENRVMFIFGGKPDDATRTVLKKNAFKWSPRRNAWVRHLNNAGIWAAKQVRTALDAQ